MSKYQDGTWHLAFVAGELEEGESVPKTTIRTLEPICYESFQSDRSAIFEYHNSLKLIKSVQLNIHEFLQSIVKYATDFMESEDMNEEKFDFISLNFARQFLNILSMFRSFLDHTDFSLSREFGKDSVQLQRWKDILSEQYDAHFEYRLFYKLRNYCQHIGVPPMHIEYTNSADQDGISFRLDLQRDQLLEEKSIWNKKLIQDLESAPDNISVIESLDNWSECFNSISKTLLEIKKETSSDAATRVLQYRIKYNLPSDIGQLCVLFIPTLETKPERLTLDFNWLPEKKASELLNDNPFEKRE